MGKDMDFFVLIKRKTIDYKHYLVLMLLLMYSVLTSGSKIFVHSCAATPNYLLDALAKHGKNNNLKDVELIHIPTVGPAVYNNIEYEGMC